MRRQDSHGMGPESKDSRAAVFFFRQFAGSLEDCLMASMASVKESHGKNQRFFFWNFFKSMINIHSGKHFLRVNHSPGNGSNAQKSRVAEEGSLIQIFSAGANPFPLEEICSFAVR